MRQKNQRLIFDFSPARFYLFITKKFFILRGLNNQSQCNVAVTDKRKIDDSDGDEKIM